MKGWKNLRKRWEEGATEGPETEEKQGGPLMEGAPGVRRAGAGHTQRGGLPCKEARGKWARLKCWKVHTSGRPTLCVRSCLFKEQLYVRHSLQWVDGVWRCKDCHEEGRYPAGKRGHLVSLRDELTAIRRLRSARHPVRRRSRIPAQHGDRGEGAECLAESAGLAPQASSASSDSLLCLCVLLGSWTPAQISPASTLLYFWFYTTTVSYNVSVVY